MRLADFVDPEQDLMRIESPQLVLCERRSQRMDLSRGHALDRALPKTMTGVVCLERQALIRKMKFPDLRGGNFGNSRLHQTFAYHRIGSNLATTRSRWSWLAIVGQSCRRVKYDVHPEYVSSRIDDVGSVYLCGEDRKAESCEDSLFWKNTMEDRVCW